VLAAVFIATAFLVLAGCDFFANDESRINQTITSFATAIRDNQWPTATKLCDSQKMTWTYFSGSKAYTLQADKAVTGFLDSIKEMRNRNGFFIDAIGIKANATAATVETTVRVPLCYNRMALTFGKIQTSCRIALTKQADGNWLITGLTETGERQESK